MFKASLLLLLLFAVNLTGYLIINTKGSNKRSSILVFVMLRFRVFFYLLDGIKQRRQ